MAKINYKLRKEAARQIVLSPAIRGGTVEKMAICPPTLSSLQGAGAGKSVAAYQAALDPATIGINRAKHIIRYVGTCLARGCLPCSKFRCTGKRRLATNKRLGELACQSICMSCHSTDEKARVQKRAKLKAEQKKRRKAEQSPDRCDSTSPVTGVGGFRYNNSPPSVPTKAESAAEGAAALTLAGVFRSANKQRSGGGRKEQSRGILGKRSSAALDGVAAADAIDAEAPAAVQVDPPVFKWSPGSSGVFNKTPLVGGRLLGLQPSVAGAGLAVPQPDLQALYQLLAARRATSARAQ